MPARLNHIIVPARDRHASARFLADILGRPVGSPAGPFIPVALANGVTLDFADAETVAPQHYAFLLSEDEFDVAYGRLLDARVARWADPGRTRTGEIDHLHGGRRVYFDDPSGHVIEILTRPYAPDPE